jgi:hypothetical protein
MSKTKTILAISIFVLATTACNTPASTTTVEPTQTLAVIVEPTFPLRQPNLPATDAEVPRVSVEEARVALASGIAVIVAVRIIESYNISHIAGAINIPLTDILTDPTSLKLAKDQWIITYCT